MCVIHTYTHTHIHIYTHIHTYTHTHIHTYTHTYTHTHIHTYIIASAPETSAPAALTPVYYTNSSGTMDT